MYEGASLYYYNFKQFEIVINHIQFKIIKSLAGEIVTRLYILVSTLSSKELNWDIPYKLY